ncbi:hypothetical protein J5J10_15310 [Ciceribacter sp. L1K23]|uniref:hypothetical protein n=1 Tax=unclassified Ciceribacter TaxID=2628820 RepID=UPI001ABDCEC5|nr:MULTISPECIES: hypothetical protein [unclassified Ciceribacter]MBO3761408.1 hypothetical protein [Ciceribacter sp. L1K22]MBR0557055.1 hypothetical protein [Ciceribacter sp. L1K23]
MTGSEKKVQKIHKDAQGQFAPKQAGGQSDGVASAKPTVITGSEDATEHNRPPKPSGSSRAGRHRP